ncbi:MAG: alanine racemase [Lachnospiraceae bacterium]
MKEYNRVYAEINLDAICHNVRAMKNNIKKDTMLCGVIKADGYGHGAVPIARAIETMVWGYSVATIDEAINLREHQLEKPILVLGYTPVCRMEDAVRYNIRSTIFQYEKAVNLSKQAVLQGKTARLHIKIDTGMSRIGVPADYEAIKLIKEIKNLPGVEIEGIFTHMATADSADKSAAKEQIRKFKWLIGVLEKEGSNIPIKHCSNSAGIIDLEEANIDMVRAGISLYGLYPSEDVDKSRVALQPALELKSHVIYIKTVPEGTAVGYGGTFITDRPTKIATIPVGYGDGYPRPLSNKGYVIIRDKKVPIIGRVCMDQFMVDVTGIDNVEEDDEVILVGRSEHEVISVEELAALAGTFNYEFVCDLGKRIPRVYYQGGQIVGKKDYFHDKYE